MATVRPFAKTFTEIIPFTCVQGKWYPIVEVALVQPTGQRVPLKLLFDSGATQITLRADHAFLFSKLEEELFQTAEGEAKGIIARNQTIEFLGVVTTCDIGLLKEFPARVFVGLFGRDCFKPFGFGFWEDRHELYVTLTP